MTQQDNTAVVVVPGRSSGGGSETRQRKSSLGGSIGGKLRDASQNGLKLAKKGLSKGVSIGNGFKEFMIRGNVVDLVVAVVVGGAFTSLINAIVADIITPTIAAIFGQPDFSAIHFTINHSQFKIGHLMNALLSFFIVSLTMFFMVVMPLERLLRAVYAGRYDTKKCPECCEKVPAAARKCKFCASEFADLTAKVTL